MSRHRTDPLAGTSTGSTSRIARIACLAKRLAKIPGDAVGFLTLAVVFAFVATPTGLLMRFFGKDVLRLRRDPGARTYWVTRDRTAATRGSFFQQF